MYHYYHTIILKAFCSYYKLQLCTQLSCMAILYLNNNTAINEGVGLLGILLAKMLFC